MAKELAGLAQLAIASGALVIPGCNLAERLAPEPGPAKPQDAEAPSIVSATIRDGLLNLRFSEAIASADQVDPGKFRLTFAYYSAKTDTDSYYYYANYYTASQAARTWYTDVGRFGLDGTKLRQPAANTIQMPLPADLNVAWVCDDIKRIQKRGKTAKAGLYLHYAEAGGAAIADNGGNRLRSIAPYWLTAESSKVPGDFENKPIPVRLSCG